MLIYIYLHCISLHTVPVEVTVQNFSPRQQSSLNGAITFLRVASMNCASSFVSQTASDGQNGAAELLRSGLPSEDASREHSDICCVVKRCYCSPLWSGICFFSDDIKRGIEGLTTSRGERRKKMREIIVHKAILLKITGNDLREHRRGIQLHSPCAIRDLADAIFHSELLFFPPLPFHLTPLAAAVTTVTCLQYLSCVTL